MEAYVKCHNCGVEIKALVDKNRNIDPPRSWLFLYKTSKDQFFAYACSKWCGKDIIKHVLAKNEKDIIHTWSVQTKVKNTYKK